MRCDFDVYFSCVKSMTKTFDQDFKKLVINSNTYIPC